MAIKIKKINFSKIFWGVLSIFLVFVIWYIGSQKPSMKGLLPNPIDVIKYIFWSNSNKIGKVNIWGHIYWSMTRVITGYVLACIVGIVLGFLTGWSKLGSAIIKPFYMVLRSIPSIAWIPLAILWFGIGEQSKYFIIFISTMLIVMTNVIDGVKDVDRDYLGVARMLGTSERKMFWNIVLPCAVPQIFNGLQVGLGAAWATVIAAEMVRSSKGVGWIILMGQTAMNMTQVFAGIIIIGLIGLTLALLMRGLEAKLCAWNVRGK
ncbi:MAG: ABC transporter permease [Spirochaetaceae bacterium]|nr:ABC transporter permease [Spirochaetaceae bacterium]